MVTSSTFAVMAAYVLATILISFIINRRREISGSFSDGGRQFNYVTAGISILATYVSSMSFIGVPGWVYNGGMEALAIHLNYPIVAFFSIVFFIPVFYKLKVNSIYEYLELRFGVRTRLLNSVIFLLVQAISAGVVLYAVALILVQMLPVTITQAIIGISLFTAAYTFFGGIATVIWTDVMQSAVLLFGCVLIFYFLTDLPADTIDPVAFRQKLNIVNHHLDFQTDTTLWAGVVAVAFLHLSVFGSNQLIIQRTLATRSLEHAQKSMLLCGYGSFFIYALFALMGVLLFRFYGGAHFENSNNVILDFVLNHTSPVTIGLVMSALIAAAMSTLDSTFNSMATVATNDVYRRFIKTGENDQHYESIARKLSLFCAVLVIVPSLLSVSNESVLKNIASLLSLFVGIRLGSFLLGLFSSRANESGVMAGSVVSVLAIFVCRGLGAAWPWFAPAGTLAFLLTGYLVSLYFGELTVSYYQFASDQKALFSRPEKSHYLLLVYCAVTVLLALYLPDYLFAQLS